MWRCKNKTKNEVLSVTKYEVIKEIFYQSLSVLLYMSTRSVTTSECLTNEAKAKVLEFNDPTLLRKELVTSK